MKRLQIGLVPKSGLLLPTRTTIVAGLFLPEIGNNHDLETDGDGIMSFSEFIMCVIRSQLFSG